ncbi:tRNA pseudouridine(55) synthase TruB [Arenibaculum pallidiluteum]|uniref:tRNA pseudouridine(55) synthase TruB n=1 Tax=Arenibaculum pallidiluteum TaxID=2812559 RepID=UPI001A971F58|nr:tRNA pseudouridine(55) synthase TruB [Arenibaculum pallidiluteum]
MARKRRGQPIHGWLVIDKPLGVTSTQALARARRILDAEKAGHGGTLDPLATGVLPIALGEATKTVAWAMDGAKTYRFRVKWGEETTTEDAEGMVCATSPVRPDEAAIRAAIPAFVGEIEQVPPRYSAIKLDGERAYDLARGGEVFELASRRVRIDALRLVGIPDAEHAEFEVDCGKGTYVRSLARDIGRALGGCAHVVALRRLSVGKFTLESAIPLDDLAAMEQGAAVERHLLPIETALDDIPALALTEQEAQRLRLGQTVALLRRQDRERLDELNQVLTDAGSVALAISGGKPVALVRVEGAEIRPMRVLNI